MAAVARLTEGEEDGAGAQNHHKNVKCYYFRVFSLLRAFESLRLPFMLFVLAAKCCANQQYFRFAVNLQKRPTLSLVF